MRTFAAILVIVFVLSFQTAVVPGIRILGVRPDLVLVLLTAWTLVRGPSEGRVVVSLTAVLYGMLSGDPAGYPLLALMPIVPLATVFGDRISGSRFATTLVLVAVATLLYQAIYTLLLSLEISTPDMGSTILRVYLPAILANLALTPLVYPLMTRFSRDLRLSR